MTTKKGKQRPAADWLAAAQESIAATQSPDDFKLSQPVKPVAEKPGKTAIIPEVSGEASAYTAKLPERAGKKAGDVKPGQRPAQAARETAGTPDETVRVNGFLKGFRRYSVTRYFRSDLLNKICAQVQSNTRSIAHSHLIARGFCLALNHPKVGGWQIEYGNGLCGVSDSDVLPPLKALDVLPCPAVVIVGQEPREKSEASHITIPTVLYDLCGKYTITDRGQKSPRPNSTLWLSFYAALALQFYEREREARLSKITGGKLTVPEILELTKSPEFSFDSGLFGVPLDFWPLSFLSEIAGCDMSKVPGEEWQARINAMLGPDEQAPSPTL